MDDFLGVNNKNYYFNQVNGFGENEKFGKAISLACGDSFILVLNGNKYLVKIYIILFL